MKVELKANGKTVQVEMTEEQAKILGLVEERSRTGYERVEVEETYYLVEVDDEITNMKHNGQLDRDCYDVGNYYSNKTIAENNARADRLLRHLRQWQAQNDEPISVEDWNNESKKKWFIIYSYSSEEMYAEYYYIMRLPNTIYFATKEKAEEAIEVFKDELIWYFTEYVQRLDEEENDYRTIMLDVSESWRRLFVEQLLSAC